MRSDGVVQHDDPHIGPTELEQIKAAQEAFENAVAPGSKADQANTNAAFHDEIYRHAPNSLSQFVVEIRNHVRPGPIALWPSHADLQRSAAHHVDIVAAIETRDIDALVAPCAATLQSQGPTIRPANAVRVVVARAERRLSLTDKEFIQMESVRRLIRNGIKSLSVVE